MAKIRAALIMMIIVVSLASWYKNQAREDATTAEPKPALLTAVAPKATPGPLSAPVANARFLSNENSRVIRECLARTSSPARLHLADKTTLDDLWADLTADIRSDHSAKLDLTIMNIHVKRANGSEERLLIQPHEASSQFTYKIADTDLRVFNVDPEGLPIAKAVPPELKQESLSQAVDSFIAKDTVIFRERRSHFEFDGGEASSIETNGRLTELQLNFSHTTLGCAWQNDALTCACL